MATPERNDTRRLVLILGVGLLALAGTALLPISPTTVAHHTTAGLARDTLAMVAGESPTPSKKVRVHYRGDANAQVALQTALDTPTIKIEGGHAPLFVAVDDPAAPMLALSATIHDGRVEVGAQMGKAHTKSARLGDWIALLPPLMALFLAVAFRKVVLALGAAVLTGATIMAGWNPALAVWLELKGLVGVVSTAMGIEALPAGGYLGGVVSDPFNLQILGFTFALVGMVGLVGRMGGTRGLVDLVSPLARGPRSAQAVTAAMGVAIFFDDYANTLVVGTTGRALTDKRGLSREKLAYIVDSTSAPVAGVAIISTWIGYEVGLFDSLLGTLSGVSGMPSSGYEMFFAVLPFRFYCFFALALVFLGAITGRDIGPMYRAERRARAGQPNPVAETDVSAEQLEKPGVRPLARNAILPIGAVLLSVILWIGSYARGLDAFSPLSLSSWKLVFDLAADDIAVVLLGSALIGSALAFVLAISQRLLNPREAFVAYLNGMKTLSEAAAVLILAWAIKAVCDDVGTGMALVALVGEHLPALLLPLVVFVLSGVVAFSTGTSWGTMALVLPVAAPLAASLSGEPLIIFASLAAVLDGAIWGDHCSPISDTTVLSSTAAGCPHLEHVRTQLPYALLAMAAAGLAGYLGHVSGLPLWLSYVAGLLLMLAGLYTFGRAPGAQTCTTHT